MAFSPPSVLESRRHLPLPRQTESTITSWDQLERQLATIRKEGYAEEDGETEEGLSCTAVPVFSGDKLIMVLSISGPTSRLRALDKGQLLSSLRQAKDRVEALLA